MAPAHNKRKIFIRHILEAYDYAKLIEDNFTVEEKLNILDIGTGAGFPGLPLSIMFSHHKFWLNDRKGSRLVFIEDFISRNHIQNVDFIECEFSDIKKKSDFLNFFDVITFRAVTRLADIADSIIPLLKDTGCIVCGKGNDWENEVNSVKDRLRVCDFIHRQWGKVILLRKN